MTTFQEKIDKQMGLLHTAGFTDEILMSFGSMNRFKARLEEHFAIGVRSTAPAEGPGEPLTFTMPVVGFFKKDKDIVLFNFTYGFIDQGRDIHLVKLSASMGSQELTYEAAGLDKGLPLSFGIHQSLTLNQSLERLSACKAGQGDGGVAIDPRTAQLVDAACSVQRELLQILGYVQPLFRRERDQDEFLKDMKEAIYNKLKFPKESHPFFVIKEPWYPEDGPRMTNRFLYEFDAQHTYVRLKAVHSQVRESKKVFMMDGYKKLPEAAATYDTLFKKEQIRIFKMAHDTSAELNQHRRRPS